ncbi:MAG: hypothetical protein L6R42_003993, partial [Xanthoria sp. 1 TBL-2021]
VAILMHLRFKTISSRVKEASSPTRLANEWEGYKESSDRMVSIEHTTPEPAPPHSSGKFAESSSAGHTTDTQAGQHSSVSARALNSQDDASIAATCE